MLVDLIREHLQLALDKTTHQKECCIAEQDFPNAAGFRDAADAIKKALSKLPPSIIWTEEQVRSLNETQQDRQRHGYTCGNDSTHRPLIATRRGWVCNDCDYRQNWSHETGLPKPIFDPDNEGNESEDDY